jgi:hypothetical protein
MDTIFTGIPGVTVVHAPIKGYARYIRFDKCDGDYAKESHPWRHVKDLLRVSVLVDTIDTLIAAYTQLAAHTQPTIVKNRLNTPTHDVLAVVGFRDAVLTKCSSTSATRSS